MTAEKMSTPGGLQRRSQIESGHQTKIGAEPAAKLDKPGVVFFFFYLQCKPGCQTLIPPFFICDLGQVSEPPWISTALSIK